MQASRLTGQSLLRAEWNSNECNWSTARKKIGPVNRPCDRPIDVISIASLIFLVTSRLADQRMKAHPADGKVLHRSLGLRPVRTLSRCGWATHSPATRGRGRAPGGRTT